ncbi:MAG: metallopeptidase family protein [Planctomycetota bacterium]|nr:MAG: metallopeptidase family protein [Planctomycetota bacterium]
MDEATRNWFDAIFEEVLDAMPPRIHELMEQIPLHLEDHPSRAMMRELGIRYRDDLCGLFTGIPITDKSLEQSGVLPDVVTLFREGIMRAAADEFGRVDESALREQIRITILHEFGHYHGLDENELRALGYG